MEVEKMYFIIGILAATLSMVAFVPYVRSIFKNQTKPSGASWWTWSILAMITVVSSKAAGAPWQVLILPLWLCLSQFGVAILSVKNGDNNWDFLNKFCVMSALLGIGLWLITGEPIIALLISIAADFLASVPNFRHAWVNPEQENRLGWTLGFGSAILEIFTIRNWSVAESGWAIYFFINMSIVLFLVWRPALKKLARLI
ncbi:hypothetical protein A2818_01820 [Candidatus Nomurabacteria bacterium RIFCSPHIGHO2_01_FULL_40_12]|uniref:Uncharacterized protein n=1 Tax=Candidatus Nomurabacteria bacterium RIFCSPHIGHO2_01_FULL_40_12 TaxID=1801737 RepID=A0A1F6V0G6_9BACT|nr:MAG: hypothetical protein A2818_01820 [Candidatus Nomurabacteria bacterium RIFCSPHIGHO2_01_FULL_40_12]